MNKEFVTTALLERFAEVLISHGFVFEGEEYIRDVDTVRQSIGFALADFEPYFEISVLFGLRVHAAEKVFAQFWGTSGETCTCSFRLYDIAPEVGERVELKGKRMLKSALSRLVLAVERVALPLLDALRDAGSIERLFNGVDPMLHLLKCEPFHSLRGIILAHLVWNPDRDRLMKEYRPRVVRQGKDCEESFDRLVEYLKGRALGEP